MSFEKVDSVWVLSGFDWLLSLVCLLGRLLFESKVIEQKRLQYPKHCEPPQRHCLTLHQETSSF